MNKWAQRTVGFGQTREQRNRVLDGYHTPKIAMRKLLKFEHIPHVVWEPANGFNRISKFLIKKGHRVRTSDIFRWSEKTEVVKDFLKFSKPPKDVTCIITNPPFSLAEDFVRKAMDLLPNGGKICLLLRLQFLEGQKRSKLFETYPPKRVRVFSRRLPRMHQFGYRGKSSSSTLCFAWFIWEVGFQGDPKIYWI